MKSKLVIAALILTAAVMLVSFSSAMAADTYNYYPNLTVSNQNVVWTVDPMKFFSGKDVDPNTIVVHYWITGAEPTPYTLVPYKVSVADSQVKLWFNAADLPPNAVKNTVEGKLTTGETFLATGPGWTHGNVG
jgi:hypothetical protein